MDGLYVNRYKQAAMTFSVLFLVLFSVVTFQYIHAYIYFTPSNAWIYQISVKCPVSDQLSELIFEDAVFAEYGLIFFLMGAYFGLLKDARDYRGTPVCINKTPFTQTIARIVLSAIVIIPFFIVPTYLVS